MNKTLGLFVAIMKFCTAKNNFIYIYIYNLKSVYLGSKSLFKKVLLKTMEHCLLFSILFFQGVGILMVKELSHIFCPNTLNHDF